MADEVLIARRYMLLDRIGVGGMGEVWRTHDQLTGHTYAIKILRPPIAAAPAAELRFQREVRAMSRLHHPRIVPVIDAGSDPEVGLFFVMELQRGRPLHEATAQSRDWQALARIIDQILETLSHAHSHSVIHRDIKPDNILVDDAGETVLLDFGVARLKDRARSGTSAYDLLGTVDYAAPEQATGNRRRIGPWTDLYCFGIVMYEIFCGRVPFWASSPVQSLIMRLDQSCPPLDPRPGFHTPVGLWEVLDRLLKPEPFERYRNAAEARAAFQALANAPMELLTPEIEGLHTGPQDIFSREQVTDDEVATLLKNRRSLLTSTFEGSIGSQPPEAPLRTTTLVGRDELLLSLSKGLDHWVSNPKPGVLVLAGEPGCGKTRLVRELLSPFLAQGEVDGHHHRWRNGPSLRATMTAIAGAVGMDEETRREHFEWFLDGHGSEQLERDELVRWLLEPESRVDDRDEEMAANFLRLCTDKRPFVLAIDGVDVVNGQVLGLVRAIRTRKLRVILILAGNDPRPEVGQRTPGWLSTATRRLEPLREDQLLRIIDELVDMPQSWKTSIAHQANGNPKRLFMLLYEMRRKGELIPAFPRWSKAPDDWVPIDAASSGAYSLSSMDLSSIIDEDAY